MRKRTMFVMLRTLGDVIVSTSIVNELKKRDPSCEIYFYTEKPYGDVLKNNPNIFQVIDADRWELNSLFLEMVSGKYDAVYAPYQVRPECNAWHQFDETRHQHLMDFYWRRMGMHGDISERECFMYPSDEDFKNASGAISFDVPRIAIHSTTGVATKDWLNFDELVSELRKAGYGAVQVGAWKDRGVKDAIDFRGRFSFTELAAFLSKCVAFVGLDSGVSYIADAMKIPTIVIQGSTSPVTSGPISSRVIHLFADKTGYQDCEVVRCHSNCRHEVNCISSIKVSDVIEKLDPILANWTTPIPVGV